MKFISIGPKQYPCLFCSPLLWVVASMEINLYFKIAQAKNVFVWLFFMACPSKLYANDFFVKSCGLILKIQKFKLSVSELYTGQIAENLKEDLKLLFVKDTIQLVGVATVLNYLDTAVERVFSF